MKVYSNTLTTADIYDAAKGVCDIWLCDEMPRPRKAASGWIVSLTGSSPYTSQMGDYHKAATWSEHGQWMQRLFDIDRYAIVADYNGYEDFRDKTQRAFDGLREYHGKVRAGYEAPWLVAV